MVEGRGEGMGAAGVAQLFLENLYSRMGLAEKTVLVSIFTGNAEDNTGLRAGEPGRAGPGKVKGELQRKKKKEKKGNYGFL